MYELFTSIWFPAVLFLAALVLSVSILWRAIRMLRVAKVCQTETRGTDFIHALLGTQKSQKVLFKNLRLIENDSMFVIGKNSHLIKRTADIAYVGQGGVLLLTVVPDLGCYDNPKTGNWKHSISVGGQPVTKTVVNPFDATNPHISAMENILASEEIQQCPITRAVVFTGKNVMYTTVYKEILSPGTLFDFLRSFDAKHCLNRFEIRKIAATLQTLQERTNSSTSDENNVTGKLRASRNIPF